MSVVRENLLTRRGYTPYCGGDKCRWHWPRTTFDGEQFGCMCGWRSTFEAPFIEQYKAKWSRSAANADTSGRDRSVPGGQMTFSQPLSTQGR